MQRRVHQAKQHDDLRLRKVIIVWHFLLHRFSKSGNYSWLQASEFQKLFPLTVKISLSILPSEKQKKMYPFYEYVQSNQLARRILDVKCSGVMFIVSKSFQAFTV